MRPLRVYRVALNLPRAGAPGAGLAAWKLLDLPGVETLVVTRRRSDPLCDPVPAGVRLQFVAHPDAELGASRGLARGLRVAIKALGFAWFFLASVPGLIRFRPDVVHVHTPVPFLHMLFTRWFLRIPVCLTLHGSEVRYLERGGFWRRVVASADVVFGVSHEICAKLSDWAPGVDVEYLPNGVNLRRFRPGATRHNVVLMVGGLRWQKDYDTALRAFSRFSKGLPSWRMRIIGEGPLRGELLSRTRALGCGDRVQFAGIKDRQGVARSMREARIFLLTSVSEGFPKVVLEAAASGTPVITTRVGECASLVGEAGRVAEPGDDETLARHMVELANTPQAWRCCSEAGRALAARHSWDKLRARVADTYGSLCAPGVTSLGAVESR